MKRVAIILVLLVFIGGCLDSGQYNQSAYEPPEYLPLPEKTTAELNALDIKLPSLSYNFTPPIDGYQSKFDPSDKALLTLFQTKPRLTTDDQVQTKSDIWDVSVEAPLRWVEGYGYYLFMHIKVRNKSDLSYENATVRLSLNPQLEHYYEFFLTTGAHKTSWIVPQGFETEGTDHFFGCVFNHHFDLPSDNPFHLPAPALKQKFDIFFRDMYIFTEWDGGREVYRVNPNVIEFRKELNEDDTEEDIENKD